MSECGRPRPFRIVSRVVQMSQRDSTSLFLPGYRVFQSSDELRPRDQRCRQRCGPPVRSAPLPTPGSLLCRLIHLFHAVRIRVSAQERRRLTTVSGCNGQSRASDVIHDDFFTSIPSGRPVPVQQYVSRSARLDAYSGLTTNSSNLDEFTETVGFNFRSPFCGNKSNDFLSNSTIFPSI